MHDHAVARRSWRAVRRIVPGIGSHYCRHVRHAEHLRAGFPEIMHAPTSALQGDRRGQTRRWDEQGTQSCNPRVRHAEHRQGLWMTCARITPVTDRSAGLHAGTTPDCSACRTSGFFPQSDDLFVNRHSRIRNRKRDPPCGFACPRRARQSHESLSRAKCVRHAEQLGAVPRKTRELLARQWHRQPRRN